MSQRTEDTGREVDDRILSDFSTDPELVGYSHKTWALAVLFVGIMTFLLPQLFPLPLAIISGVGIVAGVGILFSATPPHLTPWGFAYLRLTSYTQQQIFVQSRTDTFDTKNTTNTSDTNDE